MAAGTFTLYNNVAKYLGDGTMDLDSHTFKMRLLSSSYTPAGTHDVASDLSGELSTSHGYTSGGTTMSGVSLTISGATATWTTSNQVFTASGGSITARYATIEDSTASKLLGYVLLDSTPADVTATDGNTLTVGPNASTGWFQQSVNS